MAGKIFLNIKTLIHLIFELDKIPGHIQIEGNTISDKFAKIDINLNNRINLEVNNF